MLLVGDQFHLHDPDEHLHFLFLQGLRELGEVVVAPDEFSVLLVVHRLGDVAGLNPDVFPHLEISQFERSNQHRGQSQGLSGGGVLVWQHSLEEHAHVPVFQLSTALSPQVLVHEVV